MESFRRSICDISELFWHMLFVFLFFCFPPYRFIWRCCKYVNNWFPFLWIHNVQSYITKVPAAAAWSLLIQMFDRIIIICDKTRCLICFIFFPLFLLKDFSISHHTKLIVDSLFLFYKSRYCITRCIRQWTAHRLWAATTQGTYARDGGSTTV